jgi:hypothetical protein
MAFQQTDTIDELFDFLQNKTIKNIDADYFDGRNYLVILLHDGSYAYLSSPDSLYLAVERHIVN